MLVPQLLRYELTECLLKKLMIQIPQIARSHESHELEEDVSTWPRGISNFGQLCLRGVEHFGGLPGKLLSKDNFSPFNSWGVSPSSLLESLSVLTRHTL